MSVFLLTVDHHLAYHSAHIQSCHVTLFNREKRAVDVLLKWEMTVAFSDGSSFD